MEEVPTVLTTKDRQPTAPTRGTIPMSLQLSLSDQLYRQSKIDEENRRLKKKSKGDGGSGKKGKKSKKSDSGAAEENEEDLYPVIKVTRGGELPEGTTESGNEDNDKDEAAGQNKKLDPHRALNIDLDEKPFEKKPTPPPVPVQEAPLKPTENPPSTTEKPKKKKKKTTTTTTEKEGKSKRERGDYKELLSPIDTEEKRVVPTPKSEGKPKKKKTKEGKSTEKKPSNAPIFDMMSDDIHPNGISNSQHNEQNIYKPVAESDHLTIVSTLILSSQL